MCDSWGSSTLPHAVPGRPQIFQEAHLIQNASPNLRPFFQDPEGWRLQTSFSPSSCLSSPLRENPVRFISSCPQTFSPGCLYLIGSFGVGLREVRALESHCLGTPRFLAGHVLKSRNLCVSPSSTMSLETSSTYCEEGRHEDERREVFGRPVGCCLPQPRAVVLVRTGPAPQ